MDMDKYKTTSSWYKALKVEGYEIPLALYHMLNKMIVEKNITFQDAYKELTNQGKIEIVGKTIKFYLNEKEKAEET